MSAAFRLDPSARGPWLVMIAAGLAVAGCGPRRMAAGPASVCASKDTIAQIRKAVFDRAATDQFAHDRSAMPKLAVQSRLSVRYPLLDAYDRDTQKATCSGVLNVALPGGVLSGGGAPVLKSQVQFTSQPMADGSGVHFAMTGGDEVVEGIAEADTSRWAAANGVGPRPDQPPGRQLAIVTAPTTAKAALEPVPPRPTLFERAATGDTAPTPPGQGLRIVTARAPPPRHSPPLNTAPTPTGEGPRIVAAARSVPSRRASPLDSAPTPPGAGLRIVTARAAPPRRLPPTRAVVESSIPAPRAYAEQAVPSGGARVFVHIADPDQQGEAEALQARLHRLALNGGPVSTPPVRLVRATPARAEVRCLKAADCSAARRVAAYLGDMLPGGPPTVVDLHGRYQGDAAVRPGSLELWLPAEDREPPPPPPEEGDQ